MEVFSEPDNVEKLDHAMESLKKSMKWDEDTFGLEYDLDIYNVVAVNDFNMGAMENKGLNVSRMQCTNPVGFQLPLLTTNDAHRSSTRRTCWRMPSRRTTRIMNASSRSSVT